jgi:hypothetical protein
MVKHGCRQVATFEDGVGNTGPDELGPGKTRPGHPAPAHLKVLGRLAGKVGPDLECFPTLIGPKRDVISFAEFSWETRGSGSNGAHGHGRAYDPTGAKSPGLLGQSGNYILQADRIL